MVLDDIFGTCSAGDWAFEVLGDLLGTCSAGDWEFEVRDDLLGTIVHLSSWTSTVPWASFLGAGVIKPTTKLLLP